MNTLKLKNLIPNQTVWINGFGEAKFIRLEGEDLVVEIRQRVPGYGACGRSGVRVSTVAIHKAAAYADADSYQYACWKGEAGAGAQLRRLIKNHRGDSV